MHLVMARTTSFSPAYIVGIFSTGRKAKIAAQYEIERRRTEELPELEMHVTEYELDDICVPLTIDVLENILNRPS